MNRPPSLVSWRRESELVGHTPHQTIAYLAWCADYADEQASGGSHYTTSWPRWVPWWFRRRV